MPFIDELETLIRARYSIIYIISHEEARVQGLVSQIAERRQKNLFEWSAATGLIPAGGSIQLQKFRNSPSKDPMVALDQVIEQVEPAIFLFKDFHPYLSRGNHTVIRKLKEIALHLKNSFKTILLVSPLLEVPLELEKEITVLQLPLPTLEDLNELLERIIEEMKRFRQVRIELEEEGKEKLLQAALGLTVAEAENVFAKLLVQNGRLSAEDVPGVLQEKQQIVRKNGLLDYHETRESLDEIGGLEHLKDWLRKRSVAFTRQAREFGLPPPRGILLIGVQGCGKSLCAKAVSNLWQMPLLRLDIGRMFASYVGSSEENIRRAIQVAESVAPAVLWVDEIDKAFAGTQGGGLGDSGTSARVLGTFITWLSEKRAPVFVVATANEIAHLPPELLRKGRLDEIFFVDLPNAEERGEIFSIHLAWRGRDPGNFDIGILASASESFSGAEIEEAINSGLYDAFYAGQELETAHILRAIQDTVPLARTMAEPLRALREWSRGRARPASLST